MSSDWLYDTRRDHTDKASGVGRSEILMVVQDGERNAFDQRWLEYELLEASVLTFQVSRPRNRASLN